MTPGEFRDFAETMRDFGITKARFGDVEIEMPMQKKIPMQAAFQDMTTFNEMSQEKVSDPVKKSLDEMSTVMKLSDEELVDKLFPVDEESM